MALYAISDVHLSLGADKPMDVLPGWEDYTRRLQENWCRLVQPEDTVVIAGDISWAMKLEDVERDFAYLHALPGKKLLLKGNHDYWWTTRRKMDTYLCEKGFDNLTFVHNSAVPVGEYAVCGTRGWLVGSMSEEDQKIVNREAGRLKASLDEAQKLGKTPVVFLHYPPIYDGVRCQPILSLLQQYGIHDCYYGHIHGRQAAKRAPVGEYEGIRMHLLSCDHVKFVPQRIF